jgi:hypothetical protein
MTTNMKSRVTSLEVLEGSSDWRGDYLDIYISVDQNGVIGLAWSRPRTLQPEPPSGMTCWDGNLTDRIRFFVRDDRAVTDRNISTEIMVDRAFEMLSVMIKESNTGVSR